MVAAGRRQLHVMHDEGRAIGEQVGFHDAAVVGGGRDLFADKHAADAEFFAVVGIDHQRRLVSPEFFRAAAQRHAEFVGSGHDGELIFVVHRLLHKRFPLRFFQVESEFVAEARGHRAVGFVGDAQDVDVRVIFSFDLLEIYARGRNFHGDVDLRFIRRGVEIRRLDRTGHRRGCGRRSRTSRASCSGVARCRGRRRAHFQIFFDRLALQRVRGRNIAETAARPDIGAAAFDFHFQRVAAAFLGFSRRVTQQIILILLAGDFLQPRQQIVGVENRKAAGAAGQFIQHLLVGASRFGKCRDDIAGLSVGTEVHRTSPRDAASPSARTASATFSASASRSAATSAAFAATTTRAAASSTTSGSAARTTAMAATTAPATMLKRDRQQQCGGRQSCKLNCGVSALRIGGRSEICRIG